ncbi:hypothetical protein TNCV_3850491 [Trichonephila clavipes]|nr:hypothetical protein TNCV_3850491 [Trichonephila clavipes]
MFGIENKIIHSGQSIIIPCLNCGGGGRWCHHLSCKSPTCLRLCQLPSPLFGKVKTTTTTCRLQQYRTSSNSAFALVFNETSQVTQFASFVSQVLLHRV